MLATLAGLACHRPIERMYYSDAYLQLAGEAIPSVDVPLARQVQWTYAVSSPAGTTVYDDGRPERAAPTEVRVAPSSAERRAGLEPEMVALKARGRSKTLEPNGNVQRVIRFQVDQLVRRALVQTGFVGPAAPAGSVLVLEMDSVDAKARDHRGRDGVIAARDVLIRDGEAVAAWRGFSGKGYVYAPDAAPAGYVDASTVAAPAGSDGVSLWIHAALVRSAADELARTRYGRSD